MSELHSHSPSKSRVEWSRWHFDIDNYLNRFIPGPPWRWVPRPISHFFGYRGDQPPRAIGNLVIAFWALIGVFCGVSVTMSVSMRVPSFEHHNAPLIIASMGAAAVLQFALIDSPFAQPRNAILSQVIASVIGVGIAKLFALNPHAAALPELSAPLACAIVTAVMILTNTSHPPAGATAVLAVTEGTGMGWWLIPVVILESTLMVAVACVINNIQRRYPAYWWTPLALSRKREEDVEKAKKEEPGVISGSSSARESLSEQPIQIVIRRDEVIMPDNIWITAEEREVLETISHRLR
ncbi:HPP family protein [Aspergillus ruber CBS 135680]|uniref:HPP family protein n=1 Tax=Aspergillus ruber (strain CBS 135680) TaxID=1388766 RepID=A0A017SER8_ASPRC|nr:HPP family protein [Aspergillus ruber CBS 135680]EYE94740.1 HPP family protein [Aspergillus ruber CBS 135680]